ncbi:CLUMA_CG009453, isoform A [Clunio marinus]|uniref:CLUMA_CG009453, isoform A n=1 Tax=Clunio marinus TaxID=568069 RepID=A0A1J1I6U7_9DIPT|nr:CLUMA_CG009453, isoform A [Clunio marinus]
MYDPNVNLTNHIADLNQKWSENLRKSKDKLDLGKLDELHQETVNLVLDFRLAIQPENIEEMLNELTKLKKILIECSSRFSDLNMDESFETIHTLEKWDSSATAALLSGKIVARSSKFASNFEKKLLNEADNIINARLESLIILFQSTKCTDTSQMIVNCLETYKKLLIAEPCLQNKFTCKTVENLITMLLIVTCHRREFDHLKSLIKFFPHHRKIQFILNKLKNCEEQVTKIHQNKIFICICIAQDLLKSEYEKPLQEQNLKNYNLYVNLIVDLAMQDKFANDELRKVLLSAVSYDMNVLSSFYYLAADVLRFKMPGIHDILIIELFSIGLSHDLSYLEEIKYNNIKDTNYLNQEFICTNKRMFMALTTLGSIVKDYNLQRLCFQAASVCESETKFSKTILELLPENVRLVPPKVENKNEEMERTLMNLKEQLETFQCAIKTDFNIANSWEKSSLLCYENLDFLNHRIRLSEDLKPLVYAGVERYMKRPRLESSEETDGEVDKKKSLEVEKILTENQFFTNKISERFKSIKYLNNDSENQSVLLPSEVKAFIIKTFSQCSDFDIDKSGEIFMKLLSDVSLENLRNYRLHWFTINENQQKLNEKNLFFDFDMTPKLNETCDVMKMYQSGNVRVYDLCNDNCNIFDIENVMFYAIMEKKSLYIPSEFVLFNRNESYKTTKCQTQAAFNFLMFKQNPEGRRLSRIVNTAYKSSGMFEFCLETYLFDCESGRYKYVRRNENEISTGDVETFSSQNEAVEHLKKPQSSSKPKGGYPTITTTDTSHGSDDFINVFLLLQNELSNIAGEKIKLDINFFCDESSQHKIDFTQCTSTTLPITINKVRNTLKVPSIRIEKEIPATIHGSVVVHQVFRDNIVYDENNDNPKLVITSETTLSGTIVLNYMSHNLKNLEIKCDVNGVKSQIKCSLRSGMRGMKTSSASKALADDSMKDPTTNFEPSPKKIKIECREILANFLNSKQNENHSVQERQQLSDVISNYHQQPQQTSDTSTYQNGVHHENHQENQTTIQNLSSSSNYLQYLDIYDVVKKENYSPGFPPTTQVSYQHQQQFSNPLFQNGCQSSVIVGNGGDGVDLLTSPPPLVSNNNVINMEKVKILSNDLVSPPKKPSFSKPIEEILESNSILHVANSVSENIAISSINDVENKMLLDDIKSEMNSSISTEIDFEDEITPKFIPFSKPRIEECMRVMKDELPSKSPPPLHYPPSAVVLKDEKISKNGFDMEKKRVDELDCFDDDDDDDNDDDDDVVMEIESSRETIVIDLTDEFDNNDDPLKIPRRKPGPKSAHRRQRLSDIQSSLNLSSYNNMMPSTELEISDEDFNTDFNRVLKKFEKKVSIENSSLKRPRLLSNDSITNRLSMAKSEVRLFDVMEQMKQHEPKVNMNIKINQVKMKLPSNIKPIKPNRRDFQIQNITLEQPYEDSSEFVSNFNQSTFHIVYQNCQQETEVDQQSTKIEQKPKKNVDHSTLEQLREFDMVLEQVLERSSSEATSVSPPTPESPKKTITTEGKIKTEIKLNSVTITSISPSVSPSLKTSTGGGSAGKVAPKVQEDEHTAQRILDILANYKEQVRNSPDLNNKPAPRRRANPPTNPPVAKRKKVIASGSSSSNMKSSKQFGSTSDMMTDTMGSEEDSSCGMGSGVASTGSMNNSPQAHDIDDQTDVSRNRTILTSSNDVSQNAAFKTIRMQSEGSGSVNRSNNSSDSSTNTFCLRPIQTLTQQCNDGTKSTFTSCQSNLVTVKQEEDTNDSQNSKFVSDKTLITEIIQQQQKLSTHQHPQQNFMIKLNEHQPSDPRSSSSIMFVPNTSDDEVTVKESFDETPEIKIEEMDYDDYMKEDVIDLLNDADAMSKSPMLNMKIENK